MKTAQRDRQSGSTMAIAMLTTLVLGVFVALAVDYTGNIGRNAQRDRVFNTAVEIGDGCLEITFGGWRKLSATAENPPTSTFDAIPSPTAADFPSYPGAVISNVDVQAVDPLITLASDNPPVSALSTTTVPPKTTGPGSGTFSYFYLATADVTLPYMSGTLTAKVRRVFEKRYTSTWNWAMLYHDDLELHPESPMKLTGWVHSNKNVYVGNGTSDPLGAPPPTNVLLEDRLTYAGNYLVGYSPLNSTHAGWGNVADPQAPLDLPPGSEQTYAPFGLDSTKFIPGGTSANDDGYRELIEIKASGTDLLQSQRLYNQANIAITIDGSNVVRVYTGITTTAGTSKTHVTSGSGGGLSAAAYNAAAESITTGSSIQDNREQGSGPVRVVNFDVKEFMDRFPASKSPDAKNFNASQDWNGIVYISDTSGSATTKRAIRIRNGARLPTGGMTIVSDNPVYIEGDFNTGRTKDGSGNVTAETPSNLTSGANYEDPDVSGYQRRPASIMADAISLLSNNWSDSNAAGMSTRVASNTTVNAALVAGNVPSGTTDGYSGGGENFVRLLEDWTGKSFTYYGSMVCPYQSKQGVGPWSTALGDNVYRPANQHWYFDTTLSVDADGEPVRVPGHVSTVAYLQQQRWYLQY